MNTSHHHVPLILSWPYPPCRRHGLGPQPPAAVTFMPPWASPLCKAKAGLGQVDADIKWQHQFKGPWSMIMAASVTQLLGDAQNGPLVRCKTAPTATISANDAF